MPKKAPVNLAIQTIRMPLPAWVSLSHRLSGLLLILGVGLLLWLLDRSLSSSYGFNQVRELLSESIMLRLLLWVVMVALSYHLVAGIRHILMDFGVGESLEGGRHGALAVLVVVGILALLLGVWIW